MVNHLSPVNLTIENAHYKLEFMIVSCECGSSLFRGSSRTNRRVVRVKVRVPGLAAVFAAL
jgi:hypothetical protein